MATHDPAAGVTLRPHDFLPPQRPPSAADYRDLARLLFDAADDVRSRHPTSILDALGWEAERAAEDLEELEGD